MQDMIIKRICSLNFLKENRIKLDNRKNKEGCYSTGTNAQRGRRSPIPGTIPSQAGQGSEEPDLVLDVSALCREFGLDDL